MGSTGKKRTTMAKLNRESKLREKRAEKQARKAARRSTVTSDSAQEASPSDALGAGSDEPEPGLPDGADLAAVAAASRRYGQ